MGCWYIVADAVFADVGQSEGQCDVASSALRGARPVVDLTRASVVPHRPDDHRAPRLLFFEPICFDFERV